MTSGDACPTGRGDFVVGQPSPVDITKFRPAPLDMGKRGWVSDAAGMVVKNELILLQMGLIMKGIRNYHNDKDA